jgi:hypothetical protein
MFEADRIQIAFDEFHAEHPHVYRELVRHARLWRSHGHAKLGIATLFENREQVVQDGRMVVLPHGFADGILDSLKVGTLFG